MEKLFKLNNIEDCTEIVANYERVILEPYYYIDQDKGEDWRKFFIQVFNYWLKLGKIEVELITDFFRYLHSTFVMLDDILDSSELRRGKPAAHVIYGAGLTITAIDFSLYSYLFSWDISSSFLQELRNEQIFQFRILAVDSYQKLFQGIVMEIFWRDNFICPSEEEYFEMACKKTGQFFVLVSNYMEFYSAVKLNLKKFSLLLGVYFQIANDYIGLNLKMFIESKGFCDDIREGKFIFPIVHALNNSPNNKRMLDILKMRTNDDHLKMKCLELLEECGSMEYTRNEMINFKNLIMQEVEQLDYNDSLKKLFELHNYDQ